MQDIFSTIDKIYREKGYILFDVLLALCEQYSLGITEVSSLTGSLLDRGYLLLEDDENPDDHLDRSHLDYSVFYTEAKKIAPNLTPYLNFLENIPSPKVNEARILIKQAKKGNHYAKDRLIQMYLKIPLRMSMEYYKSFGLSLEDTLQEGNIGLIIAIKKYKISPENKFSTYAPWWIRQNIFRNTLDVCPNFYIPQYLKDNLLKIISHLGINFIKSHPYDLVSNLDLEKISEEIGIEIEDLIGQILLLEEAIPIEEVEDLKYSDFEQEMLDDITVHQKFEKIQKLLLEFSNRDREIIAMRYGLNGSTPKTLQETAEEMGVTRERIRQIESGILRKLKSLFRH